MPTPRPRPVVTIFGHTRDIGGLTTTRQLSTGHPAAYVPVRKMKWEPGSTAFGCAAFGGFVYVGVLNASTNSLNYSYIDATLHAFRPSGRTWEVLVLETDLGFTGVVGPDGYGTGDSPALVTTDAKVIALSVWDYNGWHLATYGRYPSWIVLEDGEINYAQSKTIDELRADALDGNGALSFPDQTNTFAETYAGNRGMANSDVLPNGWVVAIDYFATTGVFSGRIKVFDTDGNERAFYQWPDMQTIDGIDLQIAPKFISVDPSSTDPTDYRFVVNWDAFIRSTSTGRQFMVQELALDSTTGDITPICAPVAAVTANETANFSDYTGQQTARPVFSADGTCWVPTATRGTFNQKAMGVWFKTAGERRWAAENPATAGWEDRLGEVRVVPDFELGALAQTNQLHSGQYIDPRSGSHVVVGFLGGLFPFVPDKPLTLRSVLADNPTFASNVTGHGSFGGTGALVHDAGDGGRAKFTGNGSAANAVWQSPSGSGFIDLPRGSVGQSLWAWANFKANTTLRTVGVQVDFYEADDTHISAVTGPTRFELAGVYVKATVAAEVPEGAKKIRVFYRITGGGGNGEIHYTDEVHVSIAPVTHRTAADLDLSLLPKGAAFDIRWPAGSSSRTAVDAARFGWLPITVLDNNNSDQPAESHQYLVALDIAGLAQTPYRPRASVTRTGPTNPTRMAA